MKKRIKVFEAGKYPQGNYPISKVNDIFHKDLNGISAIFSHSSKWEKEGKKPVEIGEFSNFEIKGTEVFADVEFNEKGENYYSDGILKGVSVEIDKNVNKLLKIAVLPVGINPAVSTAEFQNNETVIIEFEEVIELGVEELLKALEGLDSQNKLTLVLAALNSINVTDVDLQPVFTKLWELDDQKWYVNKLVAEGYIVSKEAEFSKEEIERIAKLHQGTVEFSDKKNKTESEIRAEIKEELEFEAERKELITKMKRKTQPALHEMIEFALISAGKERKNIIEFSENEKGTYYEKFKNTIEKTQDHPALKNYFENIEEFSEETSNSVEEEVAARLRVYK